MNFRVRRGVATSVIVGVVVLVIVVAAAGAYFAFSSGGSSSGSTSNTSLSSSSATSTTGTKTTTLTPGGQTSSTASSTKASLSSQTQSTSSSSTSAVSSTTSTSSTSSISSTVSTSTTYSTLSCTSTTSTGTTTTDYTSQYIGLIKQFSAMQFKVSETNGTQTMNATFGYMVTSASGGIYNVNVTISSSAANETASFVVDSNNSTVLSATFSGYPMPASEAKGAFDDIMALFGLEYTYGGAINVYTDSAYFHSTGTASMAFGTVTFPVTTYVANQPSETVNECGVSATITAWTLQVGTPPGTSLQFITYLHFEGTSSGQTEDVTFQLVSMTTG